MGGKSESKAAYFEKLKNLLEEYKSIFIVEVDNVSIGGIERANGAGLTSEIGLLPADARDPYLSPW